KERQTRRMPGSRPSSGRRDRAFLVYPEQQCASARTTPCSRRPCPFARLILLFAAPPRPRAPVLSQNVWHRSNQCATQTHDEFLAAARRRGGLKQTDVPTCESGELGASFLAVNCQPSRQCDWDFPRTVMDFRRDDDASVALRPFWLAQEEGFESKRN